MDRNNERHWVTISIPKQQLWQVVSDFSLTGVLGLCIGPSNREVSRVFVLCSSRVWTPGPSFPAHSCPKGVSFGQAVPGFMETILAFYYGSGICFLSVHMPVYGTGPVPKLFGAWISALFFLSSLNIQAFCLFSVCHSRVLMFCRLSASLTTLCLLWWGHSCMLNASEVKPSFGVRLVYSWSYVRLWSLLSC